VFHSFISALAQLQRWGKVKEVRITQMLDRIDGEIVAILRIYIVLQEFTMVFAPVLWL